MRRRKDGLWETWRGWGADTLFGEVEVASDSLVFNEDRERLNAAKTLKAVGGCPLGVEGGCGDDEEASRLGLGDRPPPSETGEEGTGTR